MRILAILIIISNLLLFIDIAAADEIIEGCGPYDTVSGSQIIPSELLEEIDTKNFDFRIRLRLSYSDDSHHASARISIYVADKANNLDERCYLLHRGSGSKGFQNTIGFTDVFIKKTIAIENSYRNGLEIFIPIQEYPYLDGEDQLVWLVEVNFDENGKPLLVNVQ